MPVNVEAILGQSIIASVKDDIGLANALRSPCQTLFILYGDISTVPGIIARAKRAGRTVLLNMDLIDGYAVRAAAVKHLKEQTGVDGVLSSKATLIRAAREAGLLAIPRLFMIDSIAYHQLPDQLRASQPDCIEVLPGCLPTVIEWIRQDISLPLVAGGLVCEVKDAVASVRAGADAITTSCQRLWSPMALAQVQAARRDASWTDTYRTDTYKNRKR
jgi:glycerol uptake operon antiterminator